MDAIELVWPLTLDGQGGFAVTSDPAVKIRKHVLSLLATEPGERVMRATYGAGVTRYVFNELDDLEGESLRESVEVALSTLISEVTVTSVTVEPDPAAGLFVVSVRYVLTNGVEGLAEMNVGDGAPR